MVYKKLYKDKDAEWKEISKEEALRTVLLNYRDTPETRSMLEIGNFIPCQFSYIQVIDDNGMTAQPGTSCLIP